MDRSRRVQRYGTLASRLSDLSPEGIRWIGATRFLDSVARIERSQRLASLHEGVSSRLRTRFRRDRGTLFPSRGAQHMHALRRAQRRADRMVRVRGVTMDVDADRLRRAPSASSPAIRWFRRQLRGGACRSESVKTVIFGSLRLYCDC